MVFSVRDVGKMYVRKWIEVDRHIAHVFLYLRRIIMNSWQLDVGEFANLIFSSNSNFSAGTRYMLDSSKRAYVDVFGNE